MKNVITALTFAVLLSVTFAAPRRFNPLILKRQAKATTPQDIVLETSTFTEGFLDLETTTLAFEEDISGMTSEDPSSVVPVSEVVDPSELPIEESTIGLDYSESFGTDTSGSDFDFSTSGTDTVVSDADYSEFATATSVPDVDFSDLPSDAPVSDFGFSDSTDYATADPTDLELSGTTQFE